MKSAYCLILVLLAFAGLDARAAQTAPPTQAETRTLLTSGRFQELDQRYGAVQQAYGRGEISDIDLRSAFRTFYDTDAALAEPHLAWVKHSPKSYVAHLARGIYFKRLAGERRGGDFISETSRAQLDGMREANRIAAGEFKQSLALERKPLLTYLHMIDIASDGGDVPAARDLLDHAIAIDPKTFIVRMKYMGAIRTTWGGSTAMMTAFLKECRAVGLSADQLKELEALVLEDEAEVHRYREGDTDAAISAYVKAAELAPNHACAPCGPMIKAAGLAAEKKEYKKAVELYSKALAQDAQFVYALNGRAYNYLQMENGKLAQADFLKAAQLGNAYAQSMLGQMLLEGTSIPANRDQAIEWLTKAAAQGDRSAKVLLLVARDKTQVPRLAPGSKLQ